MGLKLATALEMQINQTILFDRKIYNYFDLPKGYQITQQEFPFANLGYLPVITESRIEKIPIKSLQFIRSNIAKIEIKKIRENS